MNQKMKRPNAEVQAERVGIDGAEVEYAPSDLLLHSEVEVNVQHTHEQEVLPGHAHIHNEVNVRHMHELEVLALHAHVHKEVNARHMRELEVLPDEGEHTEVHESAVLDCEVHDEDKVLDEEVGKGDGVRVTQPMKCTAVSC